MKKEQVDLANAVTWVPDSKTPNGIAEVPLTDLAREAFCDQMRISGPGTWLFPSDGNSSGHQKNLRTVWNLTLRRAKMPYFRIYDLRSTYATRLSAGGVADEWVTQLLHGFATVGAFLDRFGRPDSFIYFDKWFRIKERRHGRLAQPVRAPALQALRPCPKLLWVFLHFQGFQQFGESAFP